MSGDAQGHHLSRSQVAALIDERDTLREQVRQYERLLAEVLTPAVDLPRSWRLTRYEEKLLLALRKVAPNVLHQERAMLALYGMFDDDTPDINILKVFICKARRKLMEAQSRVSIETVWGRGWLLNAESTARLDEAIAAQRAPAWQPGMPLEIGPPKLRRAG